jgi:acetylornithine deacetylase/succinyl-diaminopimelate desuccinylase-like protein
MRIFYFGLLISVLIASNLRAESQVVEYCKKNESRILQDFVQFLSIPNEASETANIRRNADWIQVQMQKRGLNPRLLQAKDPAAPPVLYGEWIVQGAHRTLLFYAHYDGQPANSDEWTVTQPWQPVLRSASGDVFPLEKATIPIDPEVRIYARSASDDKAGVMAILTAFDASRETGKTLTSNLKFFFEGEEEAGSPHLHEITSQHKNLLSADAWILVDGPVHQSGRKMVDFGVRGDENVNVTVYGPVRPLHSGHYGNWAPNPAMLLVQLLASMKDESGHVLIEGWYDDVTPLSEIETRAIQEAPAADEQLQSELGIARPDGSGKRLQALILEPSLNINGIRSADVYDRARNVIPTTAMATLDLRLVKGNDYKRQFDKLLKHIQKQGYLILDREPTIEERRSHPKIALVRMAPGSYNAQRTSMDLPVSQFVIKTVQSTSGEKIVVLPSSGGSLPLSIVEQNIGCPLINVPLANHDNNQHAENENIRLKNFWNGIETIAALYTN